MSADKATPRPWKWIKPDPKDTGQGGFESESGATVCDFGDGTQYYPTEGTPPSEADAELIVRAVNSYDEREALLAEAAEALKDAQALIGLFIYRPEVVSPDGAAKRLRKVSDAKAKLEKR